MIGAVHIVHTKGYAAFVPEIAFGKVAVTMLLIAVLATPSIPRLNTLK